MHPTRTLALAALLAIAAPMSFGARAEDAKPATATPVTATPADAKKADAKAADAKATDAKATDTKSTEAKSKFTSAQIKAFLQKCSDEADGKGLNASKGKSAERKTYRRECMRKLGVEPHQAAAD